MEPKYQRDQFDFDTFKAFSGLVIRKPLADEAQLIAIHEYVIDKGLYSEFETPGTVITDKEVMAIIDNAANLNQIMELTTVYEFAQLDMKLIVRPRLRITTGKGGYAVEFPVYKYLLKGEAELEIMNEDEITFNI